MSTYGSKLRARLDPKHPCNRSFGQSGMMLPDSYYEEKFRKELFGGFSKNRVCPSCFVALPATNICDNCS